MAVAAGAALLAGAGLFLAQRWRGADRVPPRLGLAALSLLSDADLDLRDELVATVADPWALRRALLHQAGPGAARGEWRDLAATAAAPQPDHARLDEILGRTDHPSAAHRFVHLWSLWQRGLVERGEETLAALIASDLPAAAELVARARVAGPHAVVHLAVPGPVAELGGSAPPARHRLRKLTPLSTRTLAVRFELRLDDPPHEELPLLVLRADREPLAMLVLRADGEVSLETPGAAGSARGPLGTGDYEIESLWRRPAGEAIVRVRDAASGRELLSLAVPGATSEAWQGLLDVWLGGGGGSGASRGQIRNLLVAAE